MAQVGRTLKEATFILLYGLLNLLLVVVSGLHTLLNRGIHRLELELNVDELADKGRPGSGREFQGGGSGLKVIDPGASKDDSRDSRVDSGGQVHVSDSRRKSYAVAVGRRLGVYDSWDLCEPQVRGYRSARFRGFWSRIEAVEFLRRESRNSRHEDLDSTRQLLDGYWFYSSDGTSSYVRY